MNNNKTKPIDELGKGLTKIDNSKVLGGTRSTLQELPKKNNWIGSCGRIIPQ